ncbi:urease accessory protein UreF [Rufibacter glacialis]|uniref:Urease accessory protein UreF n=1 Tax=Rufibacter glacialis TaxID=1259555 RepID=A0A5M8QTI1_9BACT|nr:urease accessory protein UreF [Rufibacter glacialis]KAA6438164.1 urease accessory protein UreF [Rufibacter glacialis]GGK89169.1 urease accessory protein UreF [Rufibacter glacialis]
MENHYLISLLHLSDPTLPIGGFSHSNGLETYIQKGTVNDAASAEGYIKSMLTNNIKYNDAAFVRLAYDAAAGGEVSEVILLDQECTALKSAREIRQASIKMGGRLLKIFNRQTEHPLVQKYHEAILQKEAAGHYCIVYGLYACLMHIPAEEALLAFYYNAAVSMVTNCVKLIPLGQVEGQNILYQLHPLFHQLVQETLGLERGAVGICNIGFDIHCMQHEHLYSRLYMS